jgi:hypothetical protein
MSTRASKVNVYLCSINSSIKRSFLAKLLTSKQEFEGGLFQSVPTAAFKALVDLTNSPQDADYIFSPVNYSVLLQYPDELRSVRELAQQTQKPVLWFNYGDATDPIQISTPQSIVLRSSGYRSQLLPHELVIPAFVEDVGEQYGYAPRQKLHQTPTIGFSGMVKLPTPWQELKFQGRVLGTRARIACQSLTGAMFQGLYYRRRAMSTLLAAKEVACNFYIRNSFSGNARTVAGDPTQLRREFISSIQDSDLSLVIRGDGNFSLRFFEVLSLGRIPIFIDTDSPLPLESEIDYDSIMLRVPYQKIDVLPQLVREFWDAMTPEEYLRRQVAARELFAYTLRADRFYQHLFRRLTPR